MTVAIGSLALITSDSRPWTWIDGTKVGIEDDDGSIVWSDGSVSDCTEPVFQDVVELLEPGPA